MITSSRRAFLRGLLRPVLAGGLVSCMGPRLAQAISSSQPTGRFRRCIVLWMDGGPSQLDTFDPKAGGPRRSIATKVPGLAFAEPLAGLANHADKLCVLRSVGSAEGEHTRACELMHTGFSPRPAFPRPSLGSMVSHDRPDNGFPRYVTLGGKGFGPAFLGGTHAPFVVEDVDAARQQLDVLTKKGRELDLLTEMNAGYWWQRSSAAAQQRSYTIEAVKRLVETPFPKALDLSSRTSSERDRYGDHEFGRRLLVAARLSRLGVPWVEAQLPGWDTHVDNQRRTDALAEQLQQPWLALLEDLQQSGLWEETLVVWMGEFGRTPRLNAAAGRDHFPEVTPVVLAGGNLGGRTIGATSADGAERIGQRHEVADLMATVLTLLGLDLDAEYTTDFGSPTTKVDGGIPIAEIVSG